MSLLLAIAMTAVTSKPTPAPAALEGLEDNTPSQSSEWIWPNGSWTAWGAGGVAGNCAGEEDANGYIWCDEEAPPVYCMVFVHQVYPRVRTRWFQRDCEDVAIGEHRSDNSIHLYNVQEISITHATWLMGQNLLNKSKPCNERNN